MDDKDDTDVFNWAGADGRAMDAAGCNGWKDGNAIAHCKDNMKQGKRWQLVVTDKPLLIFRASLKGRNGVADHTYEFRKTSLLHSKSGSYSKLMVKECAAVGMLPVCDLPNYCKNDKAAIYLGQDHHIAVSFGHHLVRSHATQIRH